MALTKARLLKHDFPPQRKDYENNTPIANQPAPYRDFFGISGPKGLRDLCKGRAGSQFAQSIFMVTALAKRTRFCLKLSKNAQNNSCFFREKYRYKFNPQNYNQTFFDQCPFFLSFFLSFAR